MELEELYPVGFVQCAGCGAYYDSREVFKDSHTAPDYEWVGDCGHVRVKWKTAPKNQGVNE